MGSFERVVDQFGLVWHRGCVTALRRTIEEAGELRCDHQGLKATNASLEEQVVQLQAVVGTLEQEQHRVAQAWEERVGEERARHGEELTALQMQLSSQMQQVMAEDRVQAEQAVAQERTRAQAEVESVGVQAEKLLQEQQRCILTLRVGLRYMLRFGKRRRLITALPRSLALRG